VASCGRQDWPPSWSAGSKHWESPRQRPGPPEGVPASPRARTSGLSIRVQANPDRTPRAAWSSRAARATSRGTALLATAARDARTRSRAISGTTHAMANMVVPRAHGVIAQLTCSAFKPCGVHTLTSASVRTWPRLSSSQGDHQTYDPPRGQAVQLSRRLTWRR
jgi:hypothetical protein